MVEVDTLPKIMLMMVVNDQDVDTDHLDHP